MFDSWKNDKFRALYDAAQVAIIAGSRVIKWNAGDTGVEKVESFQLTPKNIAALNHEFRLRYPDECGRVRHNRTRASFP